MVVIDRASLLYVPPCLLKRILVGSLAASVLREVNAPLQERLRCKAIIAPIRMAAPPTITITIITMTAGAAGAVRAAGTNRASIINTRVRVDSRKPTLRSSKCPR